MGNLIIRFKNYENFVFLYVINIILILVCGFFIPMSAKTNLKLALVMLVLSIVVLIFEIVLVVKMRKPVEVYENGIKSGYYTIKGQDLYKHEWVENDKIYAELIIDARINMLNLYPINRKIRIYTSKALVGEIDKALKSLKIG